MMNNQDIQEEGQPLVQKKSIINNSIHTSQAEYEQDYLSTCCGGINEGFGSEYVIPQQSKFAEMNKPIGKNCSILTMLAIATANIILVVYSVLFWRDQLPFDILPKHKFWLTVFIYGIYLVIVSEANETIDYLKNPKKFDSYKNTFSGMTEGDAFIKFWIECSHQEGSGKKRKKVVTHSAQSSFYFKEVQDNSGMLENIDKIAEHTFIKYSKSYSFGDQATKQEVRRAFNKFVIDNKRDKNQKYWHRLEIVGYQEHIDFVKEPQGVSLIPYFVCLFFGMAAPYFVFMETKAARFEIKLNKILTV